MRFKIVDKTQTALQFLTGKLSVLKDMKKELEDEIEQIRAELIHLKYEINGVLDV